MVSFSSVTNLGVIIVGLIVVHQCHLFINSLDLTPACFVLYKNMTFEKLNCVLNTSPLFDWLEVDYYKYIPLFLIGGVFLVFEMNCACKGLEELHKKKCGRFILLFRTLFTIAVSGALVYLLQSYLFSKLNMGLGRFRIVAFIKDVRTSPPLCENGKFPNGHIICTIGYFGILFTYIVLGSLMLVTAVMFYSLIDFVKKIRPSSSNVVVSVIRVDNS